MKIKLENLKKINPKKKEINALFTQFIFLLKKLSLQSLEKFITVAEKIRLTVIVVQIIYAVKKIVFA